MTTDFRKQALTNAKQRLARLERKAELEALGQLATGYYYRRQLSKLKAWIAKHEASK